ncbi:MAG: major facilitator family transporter [Gammaproteobacteria bacterium]|jgi:MFS family permease|nr:major facilitator family transporter [Gammaproteobacteria bacterium]
MNIPANDGSINQKTIKLDKFTPPVPIKKPSWNTLGQLYPWLVMALCALFAFYKYVLQVSPSVMTAQLMHEFHINGVGLGNLAATYFYAYLVAQLFAGPLLDRYSPRALITGAIAICGFAAIAFANTDALTTAVFARAFMGIGTAFATVSYMKMSVLWFRPNQVAFVDGFLGTATMVGAMCGQVPLAFLVSHNGWRSSLIYCGIFGIVLAVAFLFFVRDKNTMESSADTAPKFAKIKLSDIVAILKNKKNWILTLYSGLAFTPLAVLGGLWGNPFFEAAHHLSATQAASFTSCIFLGFAIGGPLFGYFGGNVRQRIKVTMAGTGLAFLSLMMVIYVVNLPLWLFGIMLFIFGLGMGSYMSCFALAKGLNKVGFAGTVVALINTGDALFGSFTEPLIGKILDVFWQGKIVNGVHYFSTHDFQVALLLLPVYLVVAFGCLIILNRMK